MPNTIDHAVWCDDDLSDLGRIAFGYDPARLWKGSEALDGPDDAPEYQVCEEGRIFRNVPADGFKIPKGFG